MRRASTFALFLALALALALGAAPAIARETVRGSGHAVTEERPVSGFHGLAVAVPARVELDPGRAEGLTITADDNVLARMKTSVEDGVLKIRFPSELEVRPRTPIRITVRARSIDAITLTGAVRLESRRLEAGRLRVDLAGSSAIALPELAARELALHASGHCHVMAGGHADAFELRIAGAGEVNAARLETRRTDVRIAGSAQAAAWVHDELHVHLTGSGAVRYFGDPEVRKTITGSGRVERLGASPP